MMHFTPGPDVRPLPPTGPDAWSALRLRPLGPEDADGFCAHLLRLDERSRRLRFGASVKDAALRAYARSVFDGPSRLIGLFEADVLRGVAELHLGGNDASAGEGAFSLETFYRGRGHGSRLFEAFIADAQHAGVRRLTLQFLRENAAMHRMARRFAARLRFDGSETTATIEVPPAVPVDPPGWARRLAAALAPVGIAPLDPVSRPAIA